MLDIVPGQIDRQTAGISGGNRLAIMFPIFAGKDIVMRITKSLAAPVGVRQLSKSLSIDSLSIAFEIASLQMTPNLSPVELAHAQQEFAPHDPGSLFPRQPLPVDIEIAECRVTTTAQRADKRASVC